MKRLLAFLLALVMVLSLCACERDDDKKNNKDEEETEVEYPLEYEVKLATHGTVKISLEDKKNFRLSWLSDTMSREDMPWLEGSITDAQMETWLHLEGSYKERQGIYTLTPKTVLSSLKFTGKDAKAAKEGYIALCELIDPEMVEMAKGRDVDVTDDYTQMIRTIKLSIEDDEISEMIVSDTSDQRTIYSILFHSNGMVKSFTEHYDDGSLKVTTYDKKGNVTVTIVPDPSNPGGDPIDPMPPESQPPYTDPGTQPPYTQPTVSPPTVEPSYPSTDPTWAPPTEPSMPEEWDEYDYYSNGQVSCWYHFYADGSLEITNYDGEGYVSRFEYINEWGMTQYLHFFENGCLRAAFTYFQYGDQESYTRYDEYGNPVEEEWYYEGGGLRFVASYAGGNCVYYAEYDAGGNIIDEWHSEMGGGYERDLRHNEEDTLFYYVDELNCAEDGLFYTQEGYEVYIALNAPLEFWLNGNSLYDYVVEYREDYFDMSCWELLCEYMDDEGYVRLTQETCYYLQVTVTGNSNWGETDSDLYRYLAYDVA